MHELRPQITVLAAARIAYSELRAAVAAAHRDGRLSPAAYGQAKAQIDVLWQNTSPVEVDQLLAADAGDLAERHHLRAYDAVHLAALKRVGTAARCTLACWDNDLRGAASTLGYGLFPSTVNGL
jgi:predicted nucleic acid-binding protein